MHYPGMVRLPHLAGALTYAAAWLVPWRSVYRVRPYDADLTFFVHRRDVIGRHITKYGTHEPAMTGWIARHLASSPEGIVVDVGANMGWHAIHAARHRAVETVVAFEPDSFNTWLLDRNLSINHVDNVVVCACAVGARSGIAKLHRYKSSNLGRHSLIADYGRGTKLVPVRDLDGALDNLHLGDRRILLLKIDVEGYEPAVIDGAGRALIRADVVILEYTPRLSHDGGLSVERMIDRLQRCGFKSFALEESGNLAPLEPEWLRAFDGQMDVIWTR
jgi:FkbM family methyltransferase